jgi:hypothetical protein
MGVKMDASNTTKQKWASFDKNGLVLNPINIARKQSYSLHLRIFSISNQ